MTDFWKNLGFIGPAVLVTPGISHLRHTPVPVQDPISFVDGGGFVAANPGYIAWSSITYTAGDLVIVAISDDSSVPALPSGFTSVYSNGSTAPGARLAYRVTDGTETGNISGPGSQTSGAYIVIRNADTSDMSHYTATGSTAGGGPDPPSLSGCVAGSMVIAAGFLDDDLVVFDEPSDGFSIAGQGVSSSTGSSTFLLYQIISADGTYDPDAPTGTPAPFDSWDALTMEIFSL